MRSEAHAYAPLLRIEIVGAVAEIFTHPRGSPSNLSRTNPRGASMPTASRRRNATAVWPLISHELNRPALSKVDMASCCEGTMSLPLISPNSMRGHNAAGRAHGRYASSRLPSGDMMASGEAIHPCSGRSGGRAGVSVRVSGAFVFLWLRRSYVLWP